MQTDPSDPNDLTRASEPGTVTRLVSLPRPVGPVGAGGELRVGAAIAGRFTLVEEIGEGGMGSVWVAQQTEPLKRTVAIKFAKAGSNSSSVLARFEQERQALALMDHPNIAQVYDAGLTPGGQPFFVMELVRGQTLTRFCDAARLTPKQRLELFVPICQAVQHAHMKGIVHRDLKPGNLLVTQVDGKPVPKVIDFGVAKAVEGSQLEDSAATQFGMVIGTLEYMAPEQAGGLTTDVDTRADIYSLGVILYELLTGQRPLDTRHLKQAAWSELIRVIQEEDPLVPSRRLATEVTLPTLAQARQTNPAQLVSLLRGDLDWVVMKCLEKQRERRYETANALARDIQRYLADEVVEARSPTTAYRLGKFLKRNRGAAAAAAAIATALIAGLAAFAWQANVARRQRDLAESARQSESEQRRVADHERDVAVSAGAAARKAEGEATQARDQAVQEEQAARRAEADATTARNAAVASEKAAVTARTEAENNAQLAGRQAALALSTVQQLIVQATDKLQGPGLFEIREGLLQVALQSVDQVAAAYSGSTSKEATTAAALVALGDTYRRLGQPEKALRNFLKARDIAEERVKIKNGSDPSRYNLALVYTNLGLVSEETSRDMKAAIDYYQKALALFDDIDQHPMLADNPMAKPTVRFYLSDAYKYVGVYYYRVGQLVEALPYYEKAFATLRDVAASQPPNANFQVSLTKGQLAIGSTIYRLGDRAKGMATLTEARQRAETLLAANKNDVLARMNLADVLYMIGDVKAFSGNVREARVDYQGSLQVYVAIAQADPRNAYYQRTMGRLHYRLGNLDLLDAKPDAARTEFDQALKIRTELSAISKDNDRVQMELALAQAQVGQVDAAVKIADRFSAGASVDPEQRLDLARCYAVASRTVPATDAARAQSFVKKAMDAIRAAVADGYRDRFGLEGEPDFAVLVGREDFKQVLAGLPATGR